MGICANTKLFVIMACTNLTFKNIIDYCGTWYGTIYGVLKAMFVDSTYLQVDDDSSKNEGYKEDTIQGVNVIDIGGFLDISDNGLFL